MCSICILFKLSYEFRFCILIILTVAHLDEEGSEHTILVYCRSVWFSHLFHTCNKYWLWELFNLAHIRYICLSCLQILVEIIRISLVLQCMISNALIFCSIKFFLFAFFHGGWERYDNPSKLSWHLKLQEGFFLYFWKQTLINKWNELLVG